MDAEVAGLYERSKAAVIKIHAEGDPAFARLPAGPSHRVSSGFFIDATGRFVTTDTLVENATAIWVEWQGRHLPRSIARAGSAHQTRLAPT